MSVCCTEIFSSQELPKQKNLTSVCPLPPSSFTQAWGGRARTRKPKLFTRKKRHFCSHSQGQPIHKNMTCSQVRTRIWGTQKGTPSHLIKYYRYIIMRLICYTTINVQLVKKGQQNLTKYFFQACWDRTQQSMKALATCMYTFQRTPVSKSSHNFLTDV